MNRTLLLLSLVWALGLTACSAPPTPSAVAEVTTATTATPQSCRALLPPRSSVQGEFSALVCRATPDAPATASDESGAVDEAATDADAAPLDESSSVASVQIRFMHRGPDGEVVAVHDLPGDDYEATAAPPQPALWGEHVLTLDFAQERGGVLLIANWTGTRFVVTAYRYASGDEDGLSVAWRDGGLVVHTVPEGERRLLPLPPDDMDGGRFEEQSVSCEVDPGTPSARTLHLRVDTAGNVTGVSLLALTPAADGSADSCSVDADRFDGETQWSEAPAGVTSIEFSDGEDADATAGQGPREPSRLRIERSGGRYALSLRVNPPTFCGQSSALPTGLVIEPGTRTCALTD